MNQTAYTGASNADWKSLYKAGGVAALLMFVLTLVQSFIFVTNPPPSTVLEFFMLFQKSPVLGLLSLDLLLIVINILLIPIYLALYAALYQYKKSPMTVALVIGLVGTTLFFASREATFGMLSLSNQYAAASSDAERAVLLAAGQALLVIYNGTAFDLSYIFGGVIILVFSVVMLQTSVFSKATAYIGIAMGILMLAPPTIGTIGMILSLLSLIPTLIWLVPVARRLFQLGRTS
ncbi:MAG: DUF4386 family protein [Anaerolineales bacterium]|nr:DUF4386 family protein [Anaerolineales bacterium]